MPTEVPFMIPTVEQVIPTASSVVSGRFQSQTPADGTKFIMGETFTVTWVWENTGSTNWGEDFKLVFDSGTNFTVGAITERYTNTIIFPGGAAGLSLPCVAPLTPGTYTMYWHVEDSNGNTVPATANMSIAINAVEGVLTPTPAPTDQYYVAPTETPSLYIADNQN